MDGSTIVGIGAEEDTGNRIRRSMDPIDTRKTRFQECDQGRCRWICKWMENIPKGGGYSSVVVPSHSYWSYPEENVAMAGHVTKFQ